MDDFFFCDDWGLNSKLYIFYALSIPIELSSQGKKNYGRLNLPIKINRDQI